MNKWLYRAVGVASGALLLSSGVAHAESANEAKPTVDPQAKLGLLADLFTPTGGQHHLGLSIDTPRASSDRLGPANRNELLPNLGLLGGAAGGGGGGGLLAGLPLVGDLASALPIVGGLAGGGKGLLGGLPVVGGLASALPIVGGLAGGDGLDSLTAKESPVGAVTGGLTGGLTGAEAPLGGLTGGGPNAQAPNTLPALDPVGVSAQLPAQQPQANPGQVQPAIQHPAVQAPDHVGRHRAPTDTIRPVVVDPEYAESASTESLPLPQVGPLLGDSGMGTLPVTSLVRQLPLVVELPLIGALPASLSLLQTLPVVGMLTSLIPVESAHIA